MADLCRQIDLPLTTDFLGISSYGDRTTTSGVIRITSDLTQPCEGKDVLVVEDIVDTGLTMRYLLDNLATRKPASVRLCSLLHKPSRSRVPIPHRLPGVLGPGRVRGRLRAGLPGALPQPEAASGCWSRRRGSGFLRFATRWRISDVRASRRRKRTETTMAETDKEVLAAPSGGRRSGASGCWSPGC